MLARGGPTILLLAPQTTKCRGPNFVKPFMPSTMKRKHQEFMYLEQSGRSVHNYSKLFNHLAQYAPEQADIDKKRCHFMNGLSIKLQERLALSTGETFLEFISNAIIMDNAIPAHKESNKRKTMAAPSSSAPPKYWMVYAPRHTNPPHQQHQWASCLYPHPHQQAAQKALPPPLPVPHLPTPPAAGASSDNIWFNYGHVGNFA
jgi:hypothetical protein